MHTVPPLDGERKQHCTLAIEASYWAMVYAMLGYPEEATINLVLAQDHADRALSPSLDVLA